MPPAPAVPPLDPALDRRLRRMPKVELHVHLEGALDADAVWAMAARNGARLPASSVEAWCDFYAFRDFDHFLRVYIAAAGAMRTAEDWAFMAERFAAGQAAQGVAYTEAFLSASFMVPGPHAHHPIPAADLLDAIAEGTAEGERRHGVRVRYLPDVARHVPATQGPVLDFVSMGYERGLFLGLGLGGPEAGWPPELFTETFAEARRRGLRVVAHAGETAGAESVRGAVLALGAERIGHGVRAVEDASTVALLRERGVPLEVCPTSNYLLGVVPADAPHPIRALADAGVTCTVNSDDPGMFGTTLVDEYRRLAGQGFAWAELWRLNRNALEAAFLPEPERAALRARFDAWFAAEG